MLIKILSNQVSQLWEAIKFSATKVDEVDEEDLPQYLNELLHALLNDKAQCWVKLDKKRSLVWLGITRILSDKVTEKKYLFLQCLYAFQEMSLEAWKKDWTTIEQFARNEECLYISYPSRNPRIWEMSKMVGFSEAYRTFKKDLS